MYLVNLIINRFLQTVPGFFSEFLLAVQLKFRNWLWAVSYTHLYPNREQQTLINQTLGCCRLIYNKGLSMRNEAYEKGNKIGYSQTSAMLTELKK